MLKRSKYGSNYPLSELTCSGEKTGRPSPPNSSRLSAVHTSWSTDAIAYQRSSGGKGWWKSEKTRCDKSSAVSLWDDLDSFQLSMDQICGGNIFAR